MSGETSITVSESRDQSTQWVGSGGSQGKTDEASALEHSVQRLLVTASFSAELIQVPLLFWMRTLGIAADVVIAPYAAVMQELLSSESKVRSNTRGFNILLIRVADWVRDRQPNDSVGNLNHIARSAKEFVDAMRIYRNATSIPTLVTLCPSRSTLAPVYDRAMKEAENEIQRALGGMRGVTCVAHTEIARLYPVESVDDERSDVLGHIPYSDQYFAAVATLLARRIAAAVKPRCKVIALDCDNTLWKGVCGEDGAQGIDLTRGHIAFQRMLVAQYKAGVLLCLCSKNNVSDVEAVFEARKEMVLRPEHIIASRIDWSAKSESLRSLSQELGLALDSFLFIDDNEVECAEVSATCAGVMTQAFPHQESEILHFVDHVWAFDHTEVTEEAERRTQQYRQNVARKTAQLELGDLQRFLDSLNLRVDVAPMQQHQLQRVAELIQRTNQFNLTAIRRSCSEIETQWLRGVIECWVIHVEDRFGEYGLVGAIFLRECARALEVDTFVLSCRVLGRGAEPKIVNALGRLAHDRKLEGIVFRCRRTPRNVPARNFLNAAFGAYRSPEMSADEFAESVFVVPAEFAMTCVRGGAASPPEEEDVRHDSPNAETAVMTSRQWHESAYRLSRIPELLRELNSWRTTTSTAQHVAPRTLIEAEIAKIWESVLRVQRPSVHDNFFDIGGDSTRAVQVISRIDSVLDREVTVYDFFQAPTIEALAALVGTTSSNTNEVHETPSAKEAIPSAITSEQLDLIELDNAQITEIGRHIPGGVRNIQDVYPLSPLQDGILYHYLINKDGDTYILAMLFELQSASCVGSLVCALQSVIDRHDILRTAITWENVPRPLQIVLRKASLPVEDLALNSTEDRMAQLKSHMADSRDTIDLRVAPLMRLRVAADPICPLTYAVLKVHHIVCDHQSLSVLRSETMQFLRGDGGKLSSAIPYRDYVSSTMDVGRVENAEAFFLRKLGDFSEPSAPFGFADIHANASAVSIETQVLAPALSKRIRLQARRVGVSPARVFHAIWSILVARTSRRDDIVFGTVVSAAETSTQGKSSLGMFVNTLPLRVNLHEVSARQLVEHVHRGLLELTNHGQISLAAVHRCSGLSKGVPLLTSLLNYRYGTSAAKHEEMNAASVRVVGKADPWTSYPLTLTVDDERTDFHLTIKTDGRIDPFRAMGYLSTVALALVEALELTPDMPALRVNILPPEEWREIVTRFNSTDVPYRSSALVHEMFEEQVKQAPESTAIVHDGQALTYGRLNARANQLARYLRRRGARPDRLVAVCLERGPDMIVGLLATLKAGAAYIPMDPSLPSERLTHLLDDAQPVILLTRPALKNISARASATVITFEGDEMEFGVEATDNLGRGFVRPSNLAYVIYTSGSTGRPKGVSIEHRNLANYVIYAMREFDVASGNGSLIASSLSFDLTLTALYPVLLSGQTLRLCREEAGIPNLSAGIEGVSDLAPLKLTPSHVALLDRQLRTGELVGRVRTLVLGGELLQGKVVRLWQKHAPGTRVFNHYGPTETTIGCVAGEIGEVEDTVPIGRPIANTRVYILDAHLQPVPVGVIGEIHVSGAGVARGYLRRPDLTADRFIPDPFCAKGGGRMYKTGDLGRWEADGLITCLGRNDDQVKIRGHRVELGEIEIQLRSVDKVENAAVLVREVAGEKRLVAYVTPANREDLSALALRAELKRTLPDYMIPSFFVVLESLPLTPNGKLDRASLPVPELVASAAEMSDPPHGEMECMLGDIWKALLGVPRVGRHDNFFELGGHSLLVVQLTDRVRQKGFHIEARRIFESPTLADLASFVRAAEDGSSVSTTGIPLNCSKITPSMVPLVTLQGVHLSRIEEHVPGGAANIQDIYPLTPLQEGILFHHLLLDQGDGDTYVALRQFSMPSREHLDAFVNALQAVIDRHDILRIALLWDGLPNPVQVVYRRATLLVEELGQVRCESGDHTREWMKPERQRLNLSRAPVMAALIAEECDGRWLLLLKTHHVVMDHLSLDVALEEVFVHIEGNSHALPETIPYREHVVRALSHAWTRDSESYFVRKLADVTEPCAPFGLMEVSSGGADLAQAKQILSASLSDAVRVGARRLGVSAATMFHAAWSLVISRTCGRQDVVFGTVLLGRLHGAAAGSGRMLGVFINTLPLRVQLRGFTTKALVEQTHRELMELLDHEQASLALAQRCSGIDSTAPLFTALLNYRHGATFESQWSRRGIRAVHVEGRTNYPVTMSIDDTGHEFALTSQTDRCIDPRRMVDYLVTVLESMSQALTEAPTTLALALPVLPALERRRVIESLNATKVEIANDKFFHTLFETQVARAPHATAASHEGVSVSYSQLNQRANQLARYLRAQGVGPELTVGICIERGLDMLTALLGILKAGGAYVPLDPNYPLERVRYMLKDSAPSVVVTHCKFRSYFLDSPATLVLLDSLDVALAGYPVGNLSPNEVRLTQKNLIYVIYTSGSTGTPKGTCMTHRSMANLLEWHRQEFNTAEGVRVLQFAALSFDVAFQEVASTLATGGAVILVNEWIRRDPRALLELLGAQEVGRLFVPPLMLQNLAEAYADVPIRALRLNDVIVAGEQLRVTPEIIQFFKCLDGCRLHNHYGPTETHVVTAVTMMGDPSQWPLLPPIGRPVGNTMIYVLDEQRQPVPVGVQGEIYVGGMGVARGYLGRPGMTGDRFTADPFNAGQCMYKTGDIGRWREDGALDYLGRNDDQVKIRGYRIELGEIEAALAVHADVKDVAVVVHEDAHAQKRLVGYATPRRGCLLQPESLRAHLRNRLPDHMVPGTFVILDALPTTPTGKLDRRALPAPDICASAKENSDPPLGLIEEKLAAVWRELLRVEVVSRKSNFFELGGHSLLIVQMMERLRRVGLFAKIRSIYESPTLADLASTLQGRAPEQNVPPNRIPKACEHIDPQMIPFVDLKQNQIDKIVRTVPGGAGNIQDIYPLTSLQEGMLFHHLLGEGRGDAYVVSQVLSMPTRERVDNFIEALQQVIDRHDILRTAILWEDLPRPVQVVARRVTLQVEEIVLTSDQRPIDQLREMMRPERQRLDVTRAPMLRVQVASHPLSEGWYIILQLHHLACDHESLDTMLLELLTILKGESELLPEALSYRTHVAQSLALNRALDAEGFFRSKLGDLTEGTHPFNLSDVHGDGSQIERAQSPMLSELSSRIRSAGRRLGVSAATLFHVGWALVVATTSERDDVVFATVLLGRLHGSAGAHRVIGMFMNTLPLRLRLRGVVAVELVKQAQRELVDLLGHEQASLATAQRCSGIDGSASLFSSLINYRWATSDLDAAFQGAEIERLAIQSYTNFPLTLSVLDQGEGFTLTVDADRRVKASDVMEYITTAMQSLIDALEQEPQRLVTRLSILPKRSRKHLIEDFNDTAASYPDDIPVHRIFESQARQRPDAVAVIFNKRRVTYEELNILANQFAHYLLQLGLKSGECVAVLMPRSLEMLVAEIAVLKCGGVYVPIDPSAPIERQAFMVQDCHARAIISDRPEMELRGSTAKWVNYADPRPSSSPLDPDIAVHASAPVYVMYTSGSTGVAKGVVVPHRAVNRLAINNGYTQITTSDCVAHVSNPAFDASTFEVWAALLNGASVVVVAQTVVLEPEQLAQLLEEERVSVLWLTVGLLARYAAASASAFTRLRYLLTGGDIVQPGVVAPVLREAAACNVINAYGPTECTTFSTTYPINPVDQEKSSLPIGRPISNAQVYILTSELSPVPIGVAGEIYIGGAGIALGYLNRPELTSERFIADPFSGRPDSRLYRTGDYGRWMSDGNIEFLGRKDQQVKIRGFRVELEEIEACLLAIPFVKQAVVVARQDGAANKKLLGYVTCTRNDACGEELRSHLEINLPDYMIPAAFVVMDRIPITSNGKPDRNALPVPAIEAYTTNSFEPPRGKVEQLLADIWRQLLKVGQIGREDSFFHLGGHSLLVLEALFMIKKTLGGGLSVRDLYRYPTLRQLASRMAGNLHEDEHVDLSREATLDDSIVALIVGRPVHPQCVLVTGATGFVGRFLLERLLSETRARIYCIVRADSEADAGARVVRTLSNWGMCHGSDLGRVVAVAGDLGLPKFGMDTTTYEALCQDVDCVFHCGTRMNHLETYAMARLENVESARELVKFATLSRPKLINYISTFSTFSASTRGTTRVVSEETTIDNEKHSAADGYAASKWVAEKIFLKASERGIPCNIFRLGLMWADSQRGRYDPLQREYRLFKSCLLSGFGIKNYRYSMPPTPVDFAAQAIVALAHHHSEGHGRFHISSEASMQEGVFECYNRLFDRPLQLLSFYEWICKMKQLHLEGKSLSIVPLIEFAFSMTESEFYNYLQRVPSASTQVDSRRTRSELRDLGIATAGVDEHLLRRFVIGLSERDVDLIETTKMAS